MVGWLDDRGWSFLHPSTPPLIHSSTVTLVALVALVAAGCGPSSNTLRSELSRGAPGRYIEGVPFVRQQRNWCGPAALAAVARHYGLKLTQDAIAREVYLANIRGSLTLDLERFAQDQGLWSHAGQGTRRDACTWLDRGVPVIVLLRENWIAYRTYHYVVLTGYHATRGTFLAHDGVKPDRPLSFARFERQHQAAGRWFLVCAPPEAVRWPLDADGHNDLGLLFERKGDTEKAAEHYRHAIRLDPKKPVYHLNLGNLHAGRRPQQAGSAYREAIRLKPNFADAHNNLAHVLLRQGQIDEALRHALRAVAIGTPHAAHYHDTLGRVLLRLGRAAEAADAFRAAIKASGKDIATRDEARRGLAEAQRQAQQQGKPPAP